MRSSQRATITFVAILLLFLLSFVSAELNKRDPQDPGGAPPGDAPPAKAPEDAPPAKAPEDAPPAKAPEDAPPAKAPPAGGAPAPGGNPPGKAPAPGGNPPGGAPGGAPAPGGKQPGGNPPTGGADNSTAPPPYVDPATPTVQVLMVEPKSSKNILYRIGAKIKFKWEYSSEFKNPPKSITVAAQPQVNIKTNYTIATNMSLSIQEVTWDTSTVPALPMSQYKLIICDQDGVNAPPKPGGLQTFSTLTFGLYTSQDPGNFCESCNNANSIPIISLTHIGLALITIISFSFISI